MKAKIYIIITSLIFISNCFSQKNDITSEKPKFWHHEDYGSTNIPGISLDKAINSVKHLSPKKQIIVAVIDTQIDALHEDLNTNIWTNKKEIPNNGIDDDKNGFTDDIHGWNFLGNKAGGYTVWANFEYIRILRDYEPIFKNKSKEEISVEDKFKYEQYLKAIENDKKFSKYFNSYIKSLKYDISLYQKTKDTLRHFFPKENYTYKQLDSLYRKYKINDKTYKERRDSNDQDLGALLDSYMTSIDVGLNSYAELTDALKQKDSTLNKSCSLSFNERKNIDSETSNRGYGNNKTQVEIKGIPTFSNHSTEVSSIIAAKRENNLGIKGFSDNIKIMPLTVCASGDEHDHDIALAVKYAVDNGAKVINMSFGKDLSMYPELIKEALQYAEKHNVLVIHAAGNNGMNIDESTFFPNDFYKKEVCNNFINVGSINKNHGEKMVSSFSNYGKVNVDLFAPGEDIYTAIPDNQYSFDSGTSLAAPMVSGAAALIWLYYPKLTVQQMKYIILESGTSYDLDVIVPGTKDKKVKFSELSKTGKVLNVYNAMEMAKEMNKGKCK
ncbi:S8 family serine peptidase [Flavobacterium amniphilum]|uniref:S8 family serine peptidase n=1 Tax=Flavobacterium amniphilum TaxID=1834035 RepID=UPI002029C7FA|nr:S8 family serine peptidase [Flavobacterium amniphilum]MCL9805031.1 S8 family serine peptidase [Flavobacterium amniphilum]